MAHVPTGVEIMVKLKKIGMGALVVLLLTIVVLTFVSCAKGSVKLTDEAEKISKKDVAKLRGEAKEEALKQQYDQKIKNAKAKYGGPLKVEVVSKGNSLYINGVSYTATTLHVMGEHPQDILRWVPTELTDHQYLKYWYCMQRSPDCDPAIGFSYQLDYTGHPYDGEVAGIVTEYGKAGG